MERSRGVELMLLNVVCVQCGDAEMSSSWSDARLLSAVLYALSHLHSTPLTHVLPLDAAPVTPRPAKSRDHAPAAPVSMVDDNHTASCVLGADAANFPMLVGHMLHQTEMELVGRAHSWTFRDVLDRLIVIAGNPVRHALGQVTDATTTPPEPFYGPFSGTARVSRCQKRTSGLYAARED